MSDAPAIETENLTKIYGSGRTEVVAVRDASIRVQRGEVVALLGPSGSGKSSFLTAVGLINLPTRGRIWIDGNLVVDGSSASTDLRAYRRRHVGFVFQKAHLIPFLTARDNVQIVVELNGATPRQARHRALELLDYLGVSDRANCFPATLSGGEQQRVAVARALANSPSIILADEPTAALDKQRGRQVMELLRRAGHEQNGGVIMVTHDHRALDLFDTVYEMEDGMLKIAAVDSVC